MTYGIDLRRRVVSFVESGGSKKEASKIYKVSLWCVQDWCKRTNLAANKHPSRFRKIDMKKLSLYIQNNNDAILREIALEFNVSEQAIWHALRRLKVTNKKNYAV